MKGDRINNYIKNQDVHHSQGTFKDEYMSLLKNYDVEFKNEYVFDFWDNL